MASAVTSAGSAMSSAPPSGSGGAGMDIAAPSSAGGGSGSSNQSMNGTSTASAASTADAGVAVDEPKDAGASCMPAPEQCDGEDNDCDMKIDEDIEPMRCGMNVGICKEGTSSCRNGKWDDPMTECEGAVWPSAKGEECDAARLDENCDGMSNEACACDEGDTQECGEGPYTCKKGTATCRGGKWSACEGEQKGSAEKCDGVDNDCNGKVDDGGDSLCSGKRCGGSSGCVQCLDDNDCGRSGTACKVMSCDTSRHVCVNENAENGSSCGGARTCNTGKCVACANANDCDTHTCQNKECSGGECVYTDVRLGDPSSSCSANMVCSASQACVECVGDAQCQARGPGSWVCAANTCKIASSSGCTGSEGPTCPQSKKCTSKADCPMPPGAGVVTCSSNSTGSWCEYSCQNTNSDCPSGMYCGTFICLWN